jgi:hypothetical protein
MIMCVQMGAGPRFKGRMQGGQARQAAEGDKNRCNPNKDEELTVSRETCVCWRRAMVE